MTSDTDRNDGSESASQNGSEETSFEVHHDWTTNESIAVTIVRAIAAINNVQSSELNPLSHHIDPDALDALFHSPQNRSRNPPSRVSFQYENCDIQVASTGAITIVQQ